MILVLVNTLLGVEAGRGSGELEHSTRGWANKRCPDVLLHTANMIDPRVKSQARGQKNRSRALKWGIVNLCY